MRIVFLSSSTVPWEARHATSHQALVRELSQRGHEVLFCEHTSLDGLTEGHVADIGEADLVVVSSHLPDGLAIAEWVLNHATCVVAFHDLDTPVTLEKLRRGDNEYLSRDLVGRFDLYLSSTGGPTLRTLEDEFGARRAVAFHGLVDPNVYQPVPAKPRWDLGYLGSQGDDHQPTLERLLLAPALQDPTVEFVVGDPQHPEIEWPPNVDRIEHVSTDELPVFYSSQRFALSLTNPKTLEAGWSPSKRLFEAAACGVPVISDRWDGLEEILAPDDEILVADSTEDVLDFLREVGEDERLGIARRARRRVLAEHTVERRCQQLEEEVGGVLA